MHSPDAVQFARAVSRYATTSIEGLHLTVTDYWAGCSTSFFMRPHCSLTWRQHPCVVLVVLSTAYPQHQASFHSGQHYRFPRYQHAWLHLLLSLKCSSLRLPSGPRSIWRTASCRAGADGSRERRGFRRPRSSFGCSHIEHVLAKPLAFQAEAQATDQSKHPWNRHWLRGRSRAGWFTRLGSWHQQPAWLGSS